MSASTPRVLFVCRGSATEGLGHVIRTRALIEAASERFASELFVVGDSLPVALLDGLGVPWSIVEDERSLLAAIGGEYDAVVFDLTHLDEATFQRLGDGRLTVSLSPIFDRLDECDLVFSRTRYARDGIEPTAPGRHYSLDYAIVRPECRRIETGTFADHLDDEVISVAISMGGSDAANRTLEVLESLRQLESPATFWVQLGEGYVHSYQQLVDSVRRDRRHEIILAKTNRSMWRILRNCSLAILASGVTTYEAVFAGLPSVNILAARDDAFLIRELVEAGAALDGGTLGDQGLASVRAAAERLIADREELLRMHRTGRRLIDGAGAERVADRLLEAIGERGDASRAQLPAGDGAVRPD